MFAIVGDYHTDTMHGRIVCLSNRAGIVACKQRKKGIVAARNRGFQL